MLPLVYGATMIRALSYISCDLVDALGTESLG